MYYLQRGKRYNMVFILNGTEKQKNVKLII